ncbi:MAG: NAD-binding protein [Propionibacteriaceae bacterium]|nr:NAD-binding protein [Propionibacteriaceae bacterium]
MTGPLDSARATVPSWRQRRRSRSGRSSQLRLGQVATPTQIPNQAVVFLVLRKMRGPLLVILATMTCGVLGLCLMPGLPQPDGSQGRLNAFEAFYFITSTATTIGLGELPHPFSTAQRMWTIVSIYLSVVAWGYSLGRLLSLAQDPGFQSVRRAATFRRGVHRLSEPFSVIVGYGFIGRSVARALDSRGRRMVVVDQDLTPIERLTTDLLTTDVPALTADARNPATLGLAGLDSSRCESVLALTGDDQANLQIVMTCRLLRPDLPVLARASTRRIASAMANFAPHAAINVFDDYGQFLLLSLHRPHTYRLLTWIMAEAGQELPPLTAAFDLRRWAVVADGPFGDDITEDLTSSGHEVERLCPEDGFDADLAGFDALVAGAESDSVNLALAAQVRHSWPDIFLAVRITSHNQIPLLEAFKPDSVFFPPALVVQQVISRLAVPHYWRFISTVMEADEAWSRQLTEQLVARVSQHSPRVRQLRLSAVQTPAVCRWLERGQLTLDDLFRSPQDRASHIAALPLMLVRGKRSMVLPDPATELKLDDEIVIAGREQAYDDQTEVIYDDSTLHYVVTGRDIPTSWIGRWVGRRRWGRPDRTAEASDPTGADSVADPAGADDRPADRP